jgi:hypothetical protein
MFQDRENKPISEIRSRIGDSVSLTGLSPLEPGGTAAIAGLSAAEPNILGVDFRSPWLKDRVTLSLEAQIAMIEQRANYRLTLADLGYTNRTNILELVPGIFCKVEPTGCYRLVYHNR